MFVGFPIEHLLFVYTSHGDGCLACKSGKSRPSRPSNQGWSPARRATLECSIPSMINSRLLAFSCCPNYGTIRLACRLYWTNHKGCRPSTSLLRTNQLHSTAIVDAQLTLPISRDDDAERQDAPVMTMSRCQMPRRYTVFPRQDTRLEVDVVNGFSAHSRPRTNASALPAVCAVSNSALVKHACNSGVTETLNAPPSVPTVSMEEVAIIMSSTQSNNSDQEAVKSVACQRESVIRSAADTEVLLPFAQDTDQVSTAAPADDEQDLFGLAEALRMDEKTWTSSDNIPGTASRTRVARRTFKPRHGSSLRYNMRNMQVSVPSCTTINPPWLLSQHGRPFCSEAGSSWDGPLSTRRRATAVTSWMPGLISSWLRTGQPFGPWYARNVMSPLSTAQHAEQPHNRNSHTHPQGSHTILIRLKTTSPGCSQERTASPSHGADCSRDQESLPDRPRTTRSCPGVCVNFPVRSCQAHPHHTSQDATT